MIVSRQTEKPKHKEMEMGKFKGPKGPRIHKPDPKPGGPGVVQPGGTRQQRMDPAKAQAIVDFSAAQIHHINLTMDLYAQEVVRLRQTRDQLNQQLQNLVAEFRKAGEERDEVKAELDALKAPLSTEEDLNVKRQEIRDEVKTTIEDDLEAPEPVMEKEPEVAENP